MHNLVSGSMLARSSGKNKKRILKILVADGSGYIQLWSGYISPVVCPYTCIYTLNRVSKFTNSVEPICLAHGVVFGARHRWVSKYPKTMSPTLITALVLRVWAVCLTTPVFSIGGVVPLAGCNDEQLRPIQVWARLGNTIKFLVKTYVVFCAWVCSGCAYWAFSNKRGGLFSPLHLAVHLDIYLSDWHIELIMAHCYML